MMMMINNKKLIFNPCVLLHYPYMIYTWQVYTSMCSAIPRLLSNNKVYQNGVLDDSSNVFCVVDAPVRFKFSVRENIVHQQRYLFAGQGPVPKVVHATVHSTNSVDHVFFRQGPRAIMVPDLECKQNFVRQITS